MKIFDCYFRFKPLAWLVALSLAALAASCTDGSGDGGARPGTLGVFLTDAPACGFDAVNVTIAKVRAHQSSSASDIDSGWADITLNPPRKINLLNLNNGVLENLGETPLTPGHYTQLRLVLVENNAGSLANSVIPASGVEVPLVTPSGVQSGIKLVNEFDVASGQRVDLVLDFDACKSVVTRGNGTYALKPVIKVVPFTLNGINGFVDTALLGSNVVVTAQQGGTVVQSTAPNAATGEFFLARLAPGNYDVIITADGHATVVIGAVPVATTTSVTNLSNSVMPINPPSSATNTISGSVTLNAASSPEVADVIAKQSFVAPPSVTVKSTTTLDSSVPPGAYTLSLPTGAPVLGQYGTGTLPIALVAQSGVAAAYTVEASATGYQTQSVNVNLAASAVSQNFTLAP